MKLRKAIAGIVAAAGLLTLSVGASYAQETKIVSGSSKTTTDYITYTPGGGASDGLTIFTNAGVVSYPPPTLTGLSVEFSGTPIVTPGSPTPITNQVGNYTYGGPGGLSTQVLNGGFFDIYSGSTTYLSGSFGPIKLNAQDGTSSAGTAMVNNDVTYTGGSLFDPTMWQSTGGALAVEFTSGSLISDTPLNINSFSAVDGFTFEALPVTSVVPEPSAMAGLGIGILGLLGLGCLAARRRTANKLV